MYFDLMFDFVTAFYIKFTVFISFLTINIIYPYIQMIT